MNKMSSEEAAVQIEDLQNNIDELETILEGLDQICVKDYLADSFLSSAQDRIQLGIDALNDTILQLQSYIQ